MATYTITNEIGVLGNMESGTVYRDATENTYFKNSSKYKYGSSSQAFQYASAGPVNLSYSLRASSAGLQTNTWIGGHKYYFSIWVMQRTSLVSSIQVNFHSTEVLPAATNTTLNEWERHSCCPEPKGGTTNYSGVFTINCKNHPGNNALTNIDGLMWVDLTAAFGAGNEPDKEWCDANIPFTTSSVTVDYTSKVRNAYLGVDGKARAIRQAYIGVDGKARKIKKAYIGVDGKARLLWSM